MSLLRISLLTFCVGLGLHSSPTLADSSDWEEEGGDESEDDGGDESGTDEGSGDESEDDGADTDDGAKDGRCMAAAVNPTTALSMGLGVALLFGLRRKD
jgi:hypothetical protein